MNPSALPRRSRTFLRDWIGAAGMTILAIILLTLFPSHQRQAIQSARRFTLEMAAILPAVMLLMGLFSVWVHRDTVMRYLGKQSGFKGVALALFFGALPTGPLYIAFPLAAGLRRKGASLSNIVIFLTAWACIKLPQEMVELQFLGARFMIARLVLTILAAVLMGWIVERIILSSEKKGVS